MPTHRAEWLRHVLLPLAWAVDLLLILWGRDDRFDPLGQQFGANWPGDFRAAFGLLSLETLVLYAVVRPWSYRASWGRSVLALLLVIPWAILSFIVTMHSGRILGLLVLWRLLLIPALAITVGVSVYTARRIRRGAAA
jgi:hypothetical protein